MMEEGCGKLREKVQHREQWSRWTFAPAGRQMTSRRIYIDEKCPLIPSKDEILVKNKGTSLHS